MPALFDQVYALDFGHCRLAIAVPDGTEYSGPDCLDNKRIATSYIETLKKYLRENAIKAETVHFSGAVEIAPKLGRADYICDLVSTGATLAANQLREVQTVLESEAVIIQTRAPHSWLRREKNGLRKK